MRADLLLVERGLATSRTAAQRLIAAGQVFFRNGALRECLSKSSVQLADDADLEVVAGAESRYVSRGGLKLEGALQRTGLSVKGKQCLDVGQSTGGFTDCLLQHGAASVVGVDVGFGQLHSQLRADLRVRCIEHANARKLADIGEPFDVIVADVSFISLTKVMPPWPQLLAAEGRVLSLVKPQFEVGPQYLGRGGIVRDASRYRVVERSIRDCCATLQLEVLDYFESAIQGGDGNHEFFVFARRQG